MRQIQDDIVAVVKVVAPHLSVLHLMWVVQAYVEYFRGKPVEHRGGERKGAMWALGTGAKKRVEFITHLVGENVDASWPTGEHGVYIQVGYSEIWNSEQQAAKIGLALKGLGAQVSWVHEDGDEEEWTTEKWLNVLQNVDGW